MNRITSLSASLQLVAHFSVLLIRIVCLPDGCRKFVSRASFVKCMALFVVVFSVLYNVPHCFEAVVLECWHSHFESRSLEVCPDPFSYMLIYYKYMYSIFLAVGPLVVLVALNLCIIGASVILKKGGGGSGGDTIALVSLFCFQKQHFKSLAR
ncbi:unnamed protein product [Gongylonema pulchrum]|uniref:G_PROTEIN_RECEP_F1_2 domain-containing protein n=1 Tax=Gongylonema pulchrum TaxID=637853 RepID=A0A183DG62_9BILA|nr:unnamed protein product [Gongylonema pulchrum]